MEKKQSQNDKKSNLQRKTSLEEILEEIDNYEKKEAQPFILNFKNKKFHHQPKINDYLPDPAAIQRQLDIKKRVDERHAQKFPQILIDSDEEEKDEEEEPLIPNPLAQPQAPFKFQRDLHRPKFFPLKKVHRAEPLVPQPNVVAVDPLETQKNRVKALEEAFEEQSKLLEQQKALVISLKGSYEGKIAQTLDVLDDLSVFLTDLQQPRVLLRQFQQTIPGLDIRVATLRNSLVEGSNDRKKMEKDGRIQALLDGERCKCGECFICRGNMDEQDQKDQ